MNELANSAVQAEDELSTTAPNPKPDMWKMPEPVFRKTSGRLPKPFEEKVAADVSAPDPSPVIDSQTTNPPAPEPRPRNPTLKILVVALAFAAMIAFIAVFLTVVYFLFLR